MQAHVLPQTDAQPVGPHAVSAVELRELAFRLDASPDAERDPAEAALAWRAFVDGRYTVVDQFDAHGRRYIVVRRGLPLCASLTPREREVLSYAKLAYSGKRIAYELGISQSTVALHLKSAARKLGYGSRSRLVLALAAARGERNAYCRGSPPR